MTGPGNAEASQIDQDRCAQRAEALAVQTPHATSEKPVSHTGSFSSILNGLLKWSAVLLTLGGLALHLAGYVYHVEYIEAFGLDADLFPKSVEWILIQGYQVMLVGMVKLWVFFKTEWWKLVIWGLIIGSLLWGGVCALLYGKEKLPQQFLQRSLKNRPKWVLAAVLSYGYAGFVCLSIAFAPVFVVTLIFLPAQLAIEQARADVQTKLAHHAKGCLQADSSRRCVTLKREDKPDLQGFLIESSEKALAIYLPAQNQVQVIERERVEMLVVLQKGKT